MNKLLQICGLACVLALSSGCVTIVNTKIDVEVQPAAALVTVRDSSHYKIAQHQAVDGKAVFNLHGSPEELRNLRIEVTADGYDSGEEYINAVVPRVVRITLQKDYKSVSDEIEATTVAAEKSSRNKYVLAHPDKPPAILDAIREGKIVAGMDQEQVRAALGNRNFKFEMRTEDATGEVELWNGQDRLFRYSLYFSRGWLIHWTTIARY